MLGIIPTHKVTPYVGVWIETRPRQDHERLERSLLMWECGLKLPVYRMEHKGLQVTPYVGVWIETGRNRCPLLRHEVTPYVGVWIETYRFGRSVLKNVVTPYVGVWIETGLFPLR